MSVQPKSDRRLRCSFWHIHPQFLAGDAQQVVGVCDGVIIGGIAGTAGGIAIRHADFLHSIDIVCAIRLIPQQVGPAGLRGMRGCLLATVYYIHSVTKVFGTPLELELHAGASGVIWQVRPDLLSRDGDWIFNRGFRGVVGYAVVGVGDRGTRHLSCADMNAHLVAIGCRGLDC